MGVGRGPDVLNASTQHCICASYMLVHFNLECLQWRQTTQLIHQKTEVARGTKLSIYEENEIII